MRGTPGLHEREGDLQFIFDPFHGAQDGVLNLAAEQLIILLRGGLIRASSPASGEMELRITLPREKRLARA